MKLKETLILLASLVLVAPAMAQNLALSQVLRTESEACIILPPELISGPIVTGVVADTEAQWVVAGRIQKNEISLVLWNPKTRRSNVIWKQATMPGDLGNVTLYGSLMGKPLAVVSFDNSTQILLVNPLNNTTKVLAEYSGEQRCWPVVSPTSHLAILTLFESSNISYKLIDSRGGIASLNLPQGTFLRGWDDTGDYLRLTSTPKDGKVDWILMDPKTGTTQLSGPPTRAAAVLDQKADLRFVLASGKLLDERKVEHRLKPLWLEDREGNRVILSVAPRSQGEKLLPTAALYMADYGLWAAPIERHERVAFEAMERESHRKAIMANAKQLDSALEQFALDNKGFPAPDSDILALLCGPDRYIKSDEAFRDEKGQSQFSWTWSGEMDDKGLPRDGARLGILKSRFGTITIRHNRPLEWD